VIYIGVDIQGEFGVSPNRVAKVVGPAVKRSVLFVAAVWREAAVNGIGDLPACGSRSYIDGIGAGIEYPSGNEWTGRIVNRSPDAERVEKGFGRFDMKPGLLFGPQARRRAAGGTYNIVPFRHGTPRREGEAGSGADRATLQTMPAAVYDIVKEFQRSRQTRAFYAPAVFAFKRGQPTAGSESSPMMMMARRVREYEWGDRLSEEDVPAPFNEPAKSHHVTSLYAGMVRMAADDGMKNVHSHYLTFRTVSPKSKPESWWHPGQAARPYSEKVAEMTKEQVKEMIRASVRKAFGM